MSLARWKCPEIECPNQETLEAKSNCPGCGSKAEQFSFLDIDDLLNRKAKEARLRGITLFTESTDFQQLDAKIKESLRELAVLQSRKFPKENDDILILTCLSKISVLQTEQTMRVMLNMAAYFQKLFGSL